MHRWLIGLVFMGLGACGSGFESGGGSTTDDSSSYDFGPGPCMGQPEIQKRVCGTEDDYEETICVEDEAPLSCHGAVALRALEEPNGECYEVERCTAPCLEGYCTTGGQVARLLGGDVEVEVCGDLSVLIRSVDPPLSLSIIVESRDVVERGDVHGAKQFQIRAGESAVDRCSEHGSGWWASWDAVDGTYDLEHVPATDSDPGLLRLSIAEATFEGPRAHGEPEPRFAISEVSLEATLAPSP